MGRRLQGVKHAKELFSDDTSMDSFVIHAGGQSFKKMACLTHLELYVELVLNDSLTGNRCTGSRRRELDPQIFETSCKKPRFPSLYP